MRRQVAKLTVDLQQCKKEEAEREEYIQMIVSENREDVKPCWKRNVRYEKIDFAVVFPKMYIFKILVISS